MEESECTPLSRIAEQGYIVTMVQLGDTGDHVPDQLRPTTLVKLSYSPIAFPGAEGEAFYLLPPAMAAALYAQLVYVRKHVATPEQRDRFDEIADSTMALMLADDDREQP
jgi:hypothetical protein